MLIAVNPFESPGSALTGVLGRLVEQLLRELTDSAQSRALVFTGACGSGKSFIADQLLVKMFHSTHKTDWLQDLRKVYTMDELAMAYGW